MSTRVNTEIGGFEIHSMPSNTQVAICTSFYVREELRGQGNAYILHIKQLERLIDLGYDFAYCTVTGDNPAQSRAIAKAGWTLDHTFYNSRLGVTTQCWSINVHETRNKELADIMARELVEA